jgi:hypothetical protein
MAKTERNKKDFQPDDIDTVSDRSKQGSELDGSDQNGNDPKVGDTEVDQNDDPGNRKPPWHFKAFIVISVVYLGYRIYQGVEWLLHHIK